MNQVKILIELIRIDWIYRVNVNNVELLLIRPAEVWRLSRRMAFV